MRWKPPHLEHVCERDRKRPGAELALELTTDLFDGSMSQGPQQIDTFVRTRFTSVMQSS